MEWPTANIARKVIAALLIAGGGYLGRDLPPLPFLLVMFGSMIWGYTMRED